MRESIHPNYVESTIVCACGSTFTSRSTKPSIRLDICSSCHPFFTGKQKFLDTAGRVERFQKKFEKGATVAATKKATPAPALAKGQRAAMTKKQLKILSTAPIAIPVPPSKRVPGGKGGAKPAGKPEAAKADAPKAETPKA